jgi:hypothetical protein
MLVSLRSGCATTDPSKILTEILQGRTCQHFHMIKTPSKNANGGKALNKTEINCHGEILVRPVCSPLLFVVSCMDRIFG